MEFERFKDTVEVPEKRVGFGGRCPENPATIAVVDWLQSDDKAIKIKCKSVEEIRKIQSMLATYRRRHKLDFTIFRRGLEIYCLKA